MNVLQRFCLPSVTVGLFGIMLAMPGQAQTATGSLSVQIIIVADCQVQGSPALDFGSAGALTAALTAQAAISLVCTEDTPFTIALDAGQNAVGGVNGRMMEAGGATVAYQIYRDAGRSLVWGDSQGVNTQAGTGTGDVQSFNLYGRVPNQPTPPAGTYNDTVGITLTF